MLHVHRGTLARALEGGSAKLTEVTGASLPFPLGGKDGEGRARGIQRAGSSSSPSLWARVGTHVSLALGAEALWLLGMEGQLSLSEAEAAPTDASPALL